jgi:hypothetical protein
MIYRKRPEPKGFETRVVRRFAWRPIPHKTDRTLMRWLCWVKVEQTYDVVVGWVDEGWVFDVEDK